MSNVIAFPFSDTEDSDADSPQKATFSSQGGGEEEDDEGENKQPVLGSGEVELERPIFATYLKKKGEQRRNWKTRWFVLRATKISYYKDDKEYEILNIIPLSKIHAVSSIQLVKRKNVFGIVTRQRTYYLQAKDEFEMELWVENIRAAVLKAVPQGEDRGILSPLLMASTSPRSSVAANFDLNSEAVSQNDTRSTGVSAITGPSSATGPPQSARISLTTTDRVQPELVIESSSPNSPALPPLKTTQDLLLTASKPTPIINPSPLYQSWGEDNGGGASESGDEDNLGSPTANFAQTHLNSFGDDKFKPRVFAQISDSNQPTDSPLIQGYLYKLRIGLGGVKSWKKYWFVIRKGKLSSYKNEQEYEVKRIILLPSVIAALAIDPVHNKEFSFKLVLAKKNFVFACKDEQSKQDWIRVVQDCISFYSKDA